MRATFSNPFEAKGQWFKGNLHTHTLNSDGEESAEQLVNAYRGAGYDFLSITDHGKLTETEGLSTPDLLLIPGEELCVGSSETGRFFHVVGANIGGEIPVDDLNEDGSPQNVIDLILGLGGVAWIAHPYWSDLNNKDLAGLQRHLGVEVYNTNCELTIGRGLSNVHWDDLLVKGLRPLGLAVDDAHSRERPYLPDDSCRAWVNVKAESLSTRSIIDSLTSGLFYSSCGPEITGIEIRGEEIVVSSSRARSIAFISNGGLGEKNTAEAGSLISAKYSLKGGERYVRVEVTDRKGRTAWSNPIFLES